MASYFAFKTLCLREYHQPGDLRWCLRRSFVEVVYAHELLRFDLKVGLTNYAYGVALSRISCALAIRLLRPLQERFCIYVARAPGTMYSLSSSVFYSSPTSILLSLTRGAQLAYFYNNRFVP